MVANLDIELVALAGMSSALTRNHCFHICIPLCGDYCWLILGEPTRSVSRWSQTKFTNIIVNFGMSITAQRRTILIRKHIGIFKHTLLLVLEVWDT